MAFNHPPYVDDLPHLVSPGPTYIPPPDPYDPIHTAFPGAAASPSSWGQQANLWGQQASPWGQQPSASAWPAPTNPPQPWGADRFGIGGNFNAPAASMPAIGPSFFPPDDQPVSASPWFGGGASPLGRANSLGGYSPGHGLKRSNSLGTASPSSHRAWKLPKGHRDDSYSERNLARRPRDWRADYTPSRTVLGGIMHKLSRIDSEVKEQTDSVRRKIHPLLRYATINGLHSMQAHVLALTSTLSLPSSARPANTLDLCQLACDPPTDFIRITHQLLPWYIDVYQKQPNGITVGDILQQISEQLAEPISARHFWNEALSASDRASLTQAFKERCGDDMSEISLGVKKIDFLVGWVYLIGFTRKSSGFMNIAILVQSLTL
ncbi:hypothetical protein PTI98_010664 [Pleurotus ostreatus]|nr:hypothetical protein PTI98_010664 [Pleurotus ostreatus]